GMAVDAILNDPWGVSRDSVGNFYLSENAEPRIRKVAPDGVITNFAGTGKIGVPKEGNANSVDLGAPTALAVDRPGNVYFVDANVIWRIPPDGNMTRYAGTGAAGLAGDGGPAVGARLGSPQGIAVDGSGNLFISDTNNHVIRKVSIDGSIQTVAGTG